MNQQPNKKQWAEYSTAERVELVRVMRIAGRTYSHIGAALGTSRLSIAGLINRNKSVMPQNNTAPPKVVEARATAVRKERGPGIAHKARKSRQKIRHNWVPPSPLAAVEEKVFRPLEGSNPKPLWEHNAGQCRWPVGDKLYCCNPLGDHHVYCQTHARICARKYEDAQ